MPAEDRTILKDVNLSEIIVPEKGILYITGSFVDETGAAVAASSFASLTLTLYARDETNKDIVNSLSATNILNDGVRGTVSAGGAFTLTLNGDDHTIINDDNDQEYHRALIQGTYSTTKKLKYEIDFPVRNLAKVS